MSVGPISNTTPNPTLMASRLAEGANSVKAPKVPAERITAVAPRSAPSFVQDLGLGAPDNLQAAGWSCTAQVRRGTEVLGTGSGEHHTYKGIANDLAVNAARAAAGYPIGTPLPTGVNCLVLWAD
jgi:hypothetical protein